MPNHKSRMSRSILSLLLCISLCISIEAPLAGAENFTDGGSISNAIPGNCITAKSNPEESGKDYPFCSDHNLYVRNGKAIEQRALDGGSRLSSYKVKNLKELWWVDNGWIYYSIVPSRKAKEELWRVPFSQVERTDGMLQEKDQILWDQKEKLLKDEYINAVCISGSYVVYSGSKTYYRYDLQQKTNLALEYKGKQKFIRWTEFISTLQNVPLVKDGFVFLGDPHYRKYFYCLDIEKWKLQKIPGHKLDYDQLVATNHTFFYVSGDKVWKYDPVANQSSPFIEKKAINKIIQESDPSSSHKKVEWSIHEPYGDNDKVYLQIYTTWMEGKREHERMMMLSFQEDTPFELCYEKGLSDCLKAKSKRQYLRYYDTTAESGEVWTIVDGNCTLLLYVGVKKGNARAAMREANYSLKTGEFKYVTKNDSEYYYPDYIGANQKHDCAMGYE